MSGVVSAGSLQTAEAGAAILRAGGNAVDAALAAALACFAAEPLLASAGGAGIMVLRPPGGDPVAIDFFSVVPGLEGRPERLDFQAIEIDFGAAVQAFHVGRASACVPLVFEGVAAAAQRFGTRPLAELVAPAARMAREGVVADALTARTFRLLWQILRRDPECMAEIAEGLPCDRPPGIGERVRNTRLADTLEAFAALGATPPALQRGLIEEFGIARGGLISARDIETASVNVTAPHQFTLGEWQIATSPRLGGRLVGMIAEALGEQAESDEDTEVLRQARASQAGHRARLALPPPGVRGSTTHVSVVDGEGGAASVTLTAGEGCGHVVTGTGVHINNFLGEEDLNPAGFHLHAPGAALPTMIAPTLAMHPSGRVVALGSGGSNRIRSAVGLVLDGLVRGRSITEAVTKPRVHGEDHAVWVELAERGDPTGIRARLAEGFPAVHDFSTRDFFFGGVHVAERGRAGELRGIGDARRNGAAVIVD
ncbi:gamma-glutamyltransferase [Pseudenhygromyxa sp. WMMC2535]|uniref:gamma-glutamyltransferase n=1 Tax=Pseudenhygromyxa sp. WMMC2535 TaxID=2712867 RepID=UPI001557999A|nr:gamma-glutamyltransferase [Pseudenhygromyxa sp. WMMC2535]